jgi:uncharacterized membrane protein YqjE
METPPRASTGFFRSLRTVGDSLLALVQHRIELFSLELQEEKLHLARSLLWAGAIIGMGILALTFVSLALVYGFWQNSRLTVLTSLAVVYTLATVVLGVAFHRYLSRRPPPFAATLNETTADRACFQDES